MSLYLVHGMRQYQKLPELFVSCGDASPAVLSILCISLYLLIIPAAFDIASSHVQGTSSLSFRIIGVLSLSGLLVKRYPNRPLSHSHPLSTSRFSRASNRTTLFSLTSTWILHPQPQCGHTEGTLLMPQGRALNLYCLDVRAPTGHSSIVLPEKLDVKPSSFVVSIYAPYPFSTTISSGCTATSS